MSLHPNVFLVGAPKCGTTTVADYLSRHPRVVVSDPKEPLFFCEDRPRIRKCTSWRGYLACFRDEGKPVDAVVDASVWYLYSPVALKRIHEHYPEARIVICLRNPVDFCQSLYWHQRFTGNEDTESFAEAWRLAVEQGSARPVPRQCAEPRHILYPALGQYYGPVHDYIETFGRENVLVVFQEDLARDPEAILGRICDHIGTTRESLPVTRRNPARVPRSRLVARLLQSPLKRPLYALVRRIRDAFSLPSLGLYRWLQDRNSVASRYPALPPEQRHLLVRYFENDVSRLVTLIGPAPWPDFEEKSE